MSLVGQILLSHFRDEKTEVLKVQRHSLDEALWLFFLPSNDAFHSLVQIKLVL